MVWLLLLGPIPLFVVFNMIIENTEFSSNHLCPINIKGRKMPCMMISSWLLTYPPKSAGAQMRLKSKIIISKVAVFNLLDVATFAKHLSRSGKTSFLLFNYEIYVTRLIY